MPFFDFHCHPGLKPTFADQKTAPSVWEFINAKLAVFNDVVVGVNPLFNEVLNSQSNLTQLFKGDVKLFGIALHAPESAMAEGLLSKKLINVGKMPLINADRLKHIATGKMYFKFLQEDLNRLKNTPAPASMHGAKLKIIKTAGDFDEDDSKTIFGFLIVEGLHCFYDDPTDANADENFKKNFEGFTDQNTILAINICHIEQNKFCNHAYGIQFIKNDRFLPTQQGITLKGKEIIKRMLEKNILPDVKHMSLVSRMQLYNMLKSPSGLQSFVTPIFCTHAGLTGIRWSDRAKYLLRKPQSIGKVFEVAYLKPASKYIKGVYYNCSSINLYDEDIENILLSGGLIGLSFDQRILGFADENVLRNVTTPNDVEYISNLEANFFFANNTSLSTYNGSDAVWTTEDFEVVDPSTNVVMHPLFFINQIIHILVVAKAHPSIGLGKAITSICLGTDYDGLINSIDNCKQVDQLATFKTLVQKKIPQLLKGAKLDNDGIDTAHLIENIFYNNGKNFVMKRLQVLSK